MDDTAPPSNSTATPTTTANNYNNDPFGAFHNTEVAFICTAFGALEFALLAATVPVALLYTHLVLSTTILHRNLKAILLAQAFYILGNVVTRCAFLLGQLMARNIFWWPPVGVQLASYFFIVFGNLVGHALICERIMATLWADTYEAHRRWTFTGCWTVFVFLLAGIDAYSQVISQTVATTVPDMTFCIYVLLMVASFAEIFALLRLNKMNEDRFRAQQSGAKHTLSVRYQLTENIRTGRQLGPTFVCHFLGCTTSFLIVTNYRLQLLSSVQDFALITSSAMFVEALLNFFIILTAIIFHPLLNRSAKRLFDRLKCSANSVSPSNSLPGDFHEMQIIPPNGQSPNRQQLAQVEVHFSDLRRMWGDA